jgi:hypothetical protein
MRVWATLTPGFAGGVASMGIGFRVFVGRFMGTGTRVGMPTHQKYAPMFSTCLKSQVKPRKGYPMQRSQPPNLWPMIGLSALAVESPFLVGMVLVQVLVLCEHCRGVWWTSWPILSGFIPSYVLGARYGGPHFFVTLGLVTLGFMAAVFFVSYRSRYWRLILAGSGLVFSVLAALTHALIAA